MTILTAILGMVGTAWIEIAIYNWDSLFRASTILGFMDAGSMGIFLRMNIQELEHERAMGVISLIIGLVILSEVASHILRGRYYQH